MNLKAEIKERYITSAELMQKCQMSAPLLSYHRRLGKFKNLQSYKLGTVYIFYRKEVEKLLGGINSND